MSLYRASWGHLNIINVCKLIFELQKYVLYFIPFLLYLFATIKALCTFLISTLLFLAFLSLFYQHLIIFFKVAQGGMFPRSIKTVLLCPTCFLKNLSSAITLSEASNKLDTDSVCKMKGWISAKILKLKLKFELKHFAHRTSL
jgi:hypothetical protein